MRTHLNWIAVAVGGGAGFLSSALIAILLWAGLAGIGIDEPVTTAIVGGVLSGLIIAGFVAGRLSHRSVFHGAFTGVLAGAAITILALGEGSPASVVTLAGFIAGAAILGGLGGYWAERRRRKQTQTDSGSSEVT